MTKAILMLTRKSFNLLKFSFMLGGHPCTTQNLQPRRRQRRTLLVNPLWARQAPQFTLGKCGRRQPGRCGRWSGCVFQPPPGGTLSLAAGTSAISALALASTSAIFVDEPRQLSISKASGLPFTRSSSGAGSLGSSTKQDRQSLRLRRGVGHSTFATDMVRNSGSLYPVWNLSARTTHAQLHVQDLQPSADAADRPPSER